MVDFQKVPYSSSVVAAGNAGEVRLETRAVPHPGPGELLLRMTVCGLCGTDLYKIEQGSHVGAVLGHEVIGIVEEAGTGAAFGVGERVVSPHHVACGSCRLCRTGAETQCEGFRLDRLDPGGFSELILVQEPAAARAARSVADEIPDESAIFLEPAACVLRGVDRSGLADAAERGPAAALVLGAGSMGQLHALVLRSVLPEVEIVMSEPTTERIESARLNTEARVVHPDDLAATLSELGCEGGFDAGFDTVGNPGLIDPTLELLRPGGTLVLFAHFRSAQPFAAQEAIFGRERRLIGTYSGALTEQDRVLELITSGRLRPGALVTDRFSLARFEDALRASRDPRSLKIVIEPNA